MPLHYADTKEKKPHNGVIVKHDLNHAPCGYISVSRNAEGAAQVTYAFLSGMTSCYRYDQDEQKHGQSQYVVPLGMEADPDGYNVTLRNHVHGTLQGIENQYTFYKDSRRDHEAVMYHHEDQAVAQKKTKQLTRELNLLQMGDNLKSFFGLDSRSEEKKYEARAILMQRRHAL